MFFESTKGKHCDMFALHALIWWLFKLVLLCLLHILCPCNPTTLVTVLTQIQTVMKTYLLFARTLLRVIVLSLACAEGVLENLQR